MSRKYTFVTVAHHVDYEALCLQARSMVKYLPEDLIHEIIVVDNDLRGPPREHLRGMYGKLWKYVRIIPRSAVSAPEVARLHGWFSQQILKMEIAHHVTSDRYVVLDAKNTMVYPLRRSFLENSKGKPIIFKCDYTRHGSRRWLARATRFWGLDDKSKGFVPTITPFVLVTHLVRHSMGYVARKYKKVFWKVFIENSLTEFFYYACYLMKTGQFDYDWSGRECKVIFNTTSGEKFVTSFIDKTKREQLPFFAIHRGAKLSPKCRDLIWSFLRSRGLRAARIGACA